MTASDENTYYVNMALKPLLVNKFFQLARIKVGGEEESPIWKTNSPTLCVNGTILHQAVISHGLLS